MDNLPYLVLEHVFKYLNVQDSCSMRLVCSTFNQIFLQFRNPNFRNSLHYVQLESDDKLRLFLSTFAEAEVPIPFPRFLWNVYIGSDAEVNDLGTLYASTIVELSISIYRSIDIFADRADYELFEPLSQKESLKRVSTLLHLVGSTLEMLEISFEYCWHNEMSVEDIPIPVLPKLTILDVRGASIHKWIEGLIRKAPLLEYVTRRNIDFRSDFHYKLADLGPNLVELEYDKKNKDDQRYSEKWFLANSRRYRRQISPPFTPGERTTETFLRLWNDQVRNFEVLMNFTEVGNHVFPRVQTLWTSPRTWLENPLKVFSPTKLPRLRRVILSGNPTNLSTFDFPAELSYIYPNVVELYMRVSAEPGETYAPLPYYKLFPNVTTLRLDNEVTRNLIGLLNNFPKVCHLLIQYGDSFFGDNNRNEEDHDFDLECGGKSDVVSFKHLERLEYRYLDGSEDIMSRMIRSARASALPQLMSVYLWYVIPHEKLSGTTTRQYGEVLKELDLQNVTQLQEFFEIKWWISEMGLVETEQLV